MTNADGIGVSYVSNHYAAADYAGELRSDDNINGKLPACDRPLIVRCLLLFADDISGKQSC